MYFPNIYFLKNWIKLIYGSFFFEYVNPAFYYDILISLSVSWVVMMLTLISLKISEILILHMLPSPELNKLLSSHLDETVHMNPLMCYSAKQPTVLLITFFFFCGLMLYTERCCIQAEIKNGHWGRESAQCSARSSKRWIPPDKWLPSWRGLLSRQSGRKWMRWGAKWLYAQLLPGSRAPAHPSVALLTHPRFSLYQLN